MIAAMNAQLPRRGSDLLSGGRRLALGPRWIARLWAGGLNRVLDRIDARLATGSIAATLPDGSTRMLGGRIPGFAAEVRIVSARALMRLATGGSVGWYQAWEAGEWESPDPVALFALFMANAQNLGREARAQGPWRWAARFVHRTHRNTRKRSLRNIHAHYDLGNDFYAAWLDPTMTYSGALFANAGDTLETAQCHKIEAIAGRVAGAGEVLEIGCGWGALAATLADRGARVTALSLSDEQLDWAEQRHSACAIAFQKRDYRDVTETYDAIVSVEMVEAVGQRYWPAFFDCLARCLKPGGRAALQFIAIADPLFDAYARGSDFIQTYVFPGGMLVREAEFQRLANLRELQWEARRSLAGDYAETLRLWRKNFDRAVEEGRLPPGFDHRFVRLWRYYLMYCEGGFRGGGIDAVQVTLVKG